MQKKPSDFEVLLVEHMTALYKFAFKLCKNRETAEDLVQDTVVRALVYETHYIVGTSIDAWLFTILRHLFYGKTKRERFYVDDPDDVLALNLSYKDDPCERMEARHLLLAMTSLPKMFREP